MVIAESCQAPINKCPRTNTRSFAGAGRSRPQRCRQRRCRRRPKTAAASDPFASETRRQRGWQSDHHAAIGAVAIPLSGAMAAPRIPASVMTARPPTALAPDRRRAAARFDLRPASTRQSPHVRAAAALGQPVGGWSVARARGHGRPLEPRIQPVLLVQHFGTVPEPPWVSQLYCRQRLSVEVAMPMPARPSPFQRSRLQRRRSPQVPVPSRPRQCCVRPRHPVHARTHRPWARPTHLQRQHDDIADRVNAFMFRRQCVPVDRNPAGLVVSPASRMTAGARCAGT